MYTYCKVLLEDWVRMQLADLPVLANDVVQGGAVVVLIVVVRRVPSPQIRSLSGPEARAKHTCFELVDRQTLCLHWFGARGACVLERSCSENAVFWDR